MSDYGDDAGELLFRETVRTIAYMGRSGAMHINYSRRAKAEKDAERKARQNKRNARDIASSTYAEDVNEAIDIIEAAQEQRFVPGADGNPTFDFETVRYDPEGRKYIGEVLQKNRIGYNVTLDGAIARYETAPAAAPFLCALAGSYIDNGVVAAERFKNIEEYPGGKDMLDGLRDRTQHYSLSKVAQSRNAEAKGVLSYEFNDAEFCQAFQGAMAEEGIECEVWTDRKGHSHAAVWSHQFMCRFPDEQSVEDWAHEKPQAIHDAMSKVASRDNAALEAEQAADRVKAETQHSAPQIEDPVPAEEAERLKEIAHEMHKGKAMVQDLDRTQELPRKGAR